MTRSRPEVAAFESGVLRLFTVDMARSEARTLREAVDSGGAAADRTATEALGAERVEAQWLSMVPLRDIAEIGLETYLAAGHGVPEDQLAEARGRLKSAEGAILAVPSRAFCSLAQTIQPVDALNPLAVFVTAEAPAPAASTPSEQLPPMRTVSPPYDDLPDDDDDDADGAQGRAALLRPAAILAIVLVAALLLALVALAGPV